MAGPFKTRDIEHYVQLEAAVNTSPGALVGGDAFKSKTNFALKRVLARHDRTADRDRGQASVVSTQPGRESSTWEVSGDVIPAGNAAAPTAPDMENFFEAHMGLKQAATAHTVTAAGSSGTTLNLTPGGGAASGIAAGGGDIIACDVDATNGVEARRVASRSTDVVTIDRAFTANPAAARNVYTGVTFRLSEVQNKTLHLWEFTDGNNFRHKVGGAIPRNFELNYDASGQTPVLGYKFSGQAYPIGTHSTSRPSPTVAGEPLLPAQVKVFIGASGKLCPVKVGFKNDNALELRQNEACALSPSGVKRTANESRYLAELSLDLLLVTGGVVEGYYDNASGLTAYDVIIQWGVSPGKIVVLSCPKFIPDVDPTEQDGEGALSLNGRCYGTLGDDDWYLTFL